MVRRFRRNGAPARRTTSRAADHCCCARDCRGFSVACVAPTNPHRGHQRIEDAGPSAPIKRASTSTILMTFDQTRVSRSQGSDQQTQLMGCTATGVFEEMNERHPSAVQAALHAVSRRAVKPVPDLQSRNPNGRNALTERPRPHGDRLLARTLVERGGQSAIKDRRTRKRRLQALRPRAP
jgi:hypothetical protein